ncbi:MAG: hypothetical protein LCH54_14730 [Bacteroidetes bacterium]|nr:hypothetical protein [Bacteroidota bacterium]
MLKLFLFIVISCLIFKPLQSFAQTTERTGYVFSISGGISSLQLSTSSFSDQSEIYYSIPNFKFGWMVNPKTEVSLYIPGNVYSYKGSGRHRDRIFEGLLPSVQYWFADKWWVLGGAGLTIDGMTFYDTRNKSEINFYFGSSVVAGTGYEVWSRKNMVIDLQGRIHAGSSNIPEGKRTLLAFDFLVGVNWY